MDLRVLLAAPAMVLLWGCASVPAAVSRANPPAPAPAQKSAQLNGPAVKSKLTERPFVPRQKPVPCAHQSGSTA